MALFTSLTEFFSCDSFRYPFEAIKVVTSDGYVVLLERIPRWKSLTFSCYFISWYLWIKTWCITFLGVIRRRLFCCNMEYWTHLWGEWWPNYSIGNVIDIPHKWHLLQFCVFLIFFCWYPFLPSLWSKLIVSPLCEHVISSIVQKKLYWVV